MHIALFDHDLIFEEEKRKVPNCFLRCSGLMSGLGQVVSLSCHLIVMSGHVNVRSCLYQVNQNGKKVHTLAL